jgi:4-diphosphocytidyl-2-C-methyl-D-erythritol kinase
LGLHILSKRTDGFHDIKTIFHPVYALSDVLEINPSEKFQFEQNGIKVDTAEGENLVEKAYTLLHKACKIPPVHISLYKNIPFGAGLGGGSSNAAFTLRLLNLMFNLNLSAGQLRQYASTLGSDCPFFIDNVPSLAIGRGEKLTPSPIPQLSNMYIAIVKPNIFINTTDAYRGCKITRKDIDLLEIVSQPVSSWRNNLMNDFEINIFHQYPRLKKIKKSLYRQGAVYVSLSGSGSALYGIFAEQPLSLHFDDDCFIFQGQFIDVSANQNPVK